MTTVGIADLKARLSAHLKSVRKERPLTVLDRDTPVARIVPYATEPLEVRRATRRLRTVRLSVGDACFYKNQRGAAPVIFAETGDATALGAVTLESLGLVLDAVRRDLIPLPMARSCP